MYSVSLSGGKDSTAMLLMMLERGEPIGEVLFWDSGAEFPEMYEHLEKLERRTGLSITRIELASGIEWHMCDRTMTKGKRQGQNGYGWPRPRARWCTRLKNDALDGARDHSMIACVGIAADETRPADPAKRYPLKEWGITESDALAYCLARGYDWGGLYKHFSRVSCYLCPLKGLDELRMLRLHHPELWAHMLELEARTFNDFRRDYSLYQLEERFDAESRQMEIGGVAW